MLNSRLFRLQQNQSRHFSTVLIRTNWYTISCKYRGCSGLTSVVIPNSVTTIGQAAFFNCQNLTSVTVENSNPANISLGYDVFYDVPTSTCVLNVPKGSKGLYAAADQWKDFGTIEEFTITINLADGESYTRNEDKNYVDVTYTRTFADNDFNCLYVPFDAPVSAFTDCSIYAINMFQQHDSDDDGIMDELTMEVVKAPENAVVKANHPYLIKYTGTETDTEQTFTFTNVTLHSAATPEYTCSSMNTNYTFKGTYSAIDEETATDGNYYTLVYDAAAGCVGLGLTTNGLSAQRWYMTMEARDSQFGTTNSASLAKSIRIVVSGEDGEATGVSAIDGHNGKLNGKFIENGKVVIMRNGKKFNVNGMVIK